MRYKAKSDGRLPVELEPILGDFTEDISSNNHLQYTTASRYHRSDIQMVV